MSQSLCSCCVRLQRPALIPDMRKGANMLVRAACVRCHGTKCPLLTAFFLFSLSSEVVTNLSNNHWTICPIVIGFLRSCHNTSNICSSKSHFVQPNVLCPAPAVPAVPTFWTPVGRFDYWFYKVW